MVAEKTKQPFHDRDLVYADAAYEVEHFARENGITAEQTRELIRKHGNSRHVLEIAARYLRDRS